MLRGTDVPTMMLRIGIALSKNDRNPGAEPIFLSGLGDDEFGIGALRGPASINADSQPDSARPLVGRIVAFIKRVVRRSIRWYVLPIAQQQTRFNQGVLDVNDRIRAALEEIETSMALLNQRVDEIERELRSSRQEQR